VLALSPLQPPPLPSKDIGTTITISINTLMRCHPKDDATPSLPLCGLLA